tara:strand:+ start:132 stop:413 length:282 start_codon:yes stop_codon:yes gene_type:complete
MTSPFQLKKSIHINLNKDTHSEFRIKLFKRGLSMQEVFEHLACLIVDDNNYLNSCLDKLEYNKKNRVPNKKFNSTDVESIFDVIEQQNPLEES